VTDSGNAIQYWDGGFSAYLQLPTADWWKIIEVEHQHNVVGSAFSPSKRRPEAVVPAGAYDFTVYKPGIFPSRSRRVRPQLAFEAGKYYTGRRYEASIENAFRPTGRLSIETEYEANWIHLGEEKLSIHVLSNRVVYSFTTSFFVKLYTQWNSDSQVASANLLVNYQFRPGSDLFFVYDHAFGTADRLLQRNRAVLLKLSYLLGL